ncbi:MAG: leucyl aminopeptidase family protein [Gammaproteobacteria bacterium]|nr:leucyl aminopeptidase family protein [Gammaproteobacteria bacterium]
MSDVLLSQTSGQTVPLHVVFASDYDSWVAAQPKVRQRWLLNSAFEPHSGQFSLLSDSEGGLEAVLVCLNDDTDFWAFGSLSLSLPEGVYALEASVNAPLAEKLALSWGLGAYQFARYRSATRHASKLLMKQGDLAAVQQQVEATCLCRDLVNTPAQDMMPTDLSKVMQDLAGQFGAEFSELIGEQLLENNFPAIHAVGRASVFEPRLLDLNWGDVSHPKVTLVGKGVCFDSGGLNIKPGQFMRWMKKDMGGGAHVLALASMIMAAKVPVRLRVLVPAVENAISGNAFRPGDVLASRKGLGIEIDNTDAEGRLVLCDALALAAEESPELLLDFATLTGAARVAVGTEVAAFFATNDDTAQQLMSLSAELQDPAWRLPLHQEYRGFIESKITDLLNSATVPQGGAITAALFLQAFVPDEIEWLHFDVMAWNNRPRPGRPEGGEAMGIRTVFAYLQQRYTRGA